MSANSSTNQPTKSYSDVVRSYSGRREIRVDGSEVILRGPELPESNDNGLGGEKVKSLLLANSSYGEDKNLCFVNSAINLLRIVPDFRHILMGQCGTVPLIIKELQQALNAEGTGTILSLSYLRQLVAMSVFGIMGANEKFCLRWNDFESNIGVAFREIREEKDFFDVTLSVGDRQLQAHKLILSACSPFFRSVLKNNPHQHPLLYMKGVKFSDLQSILNFMYHGQVNVAQEDLHTFLNVAEDLKVKGLTQKNIPTDEQFVSKTTYKASDTISKPISNTNALHNISSTTPKPKAILQLHNQQDNDDIKELAPVVKTEPLVEQKQQLSVNTFQQPEVQCNSYSGSESQMVGGTITQIEDKTEYGEDYGYDYGGYKEGFVGQPTGEPSKGIDPSRTKTQLWSLSGIKNSEEQGSNNQNIQTHVNGFKCTICEKYFKK